MLETARSTKLAEKTVVGLLNVNCRKLTEWVNGRINVHKLAEWLNQKPGRMSIEELTLARPWVKQIEEAVHAWTTTIAPNNLDTREGIANLGRAVDAFDAFIRDTPQTPVGHPKMPENLTEMQRKELWRIYQSSLIRAEIGIAFMNAAHSGTLHSLRRCQFCKNWFVARDADRKQVNCSVECRSAFSHEANKTKSNAARRTLKARKKRRYFMNEYRRTHPYAR